MADLQAEGVQVTLPAGWDGRITVRREGEIRGLNTLSGTPVLQEQPQPVVHVANFGLPEERGDFGGGAVELMGTQDVFVVLFEYEAEATQTPLFATVGMPRVLSPRDFDVTTLRRGIAGQSGVQIFFQENGRAFCLYVVLGSHARRARLVRLVNAVLASVVIAPRPPK